MDLSICHGFWNRDYDECAGVIETFSQGFVNLSCGVIETFSQGFLNLSWGLE